MILLNYKPVFLVKDPIGFVGYTSIDGTRDYWVESLFDD